MKDFADVAPTSIYSIPSGSYSFIVRVFRKLWLSNFLEDRHHQKLMLRFKASGINLVYSNTITNGDILKTLAPLECPVITHVHELEGWIQEIGLENLLEVKKYTSRFIAASQAAKRNLVEKHAIPSEKIDVVHSFIPIPKIEPRADAVIGIREKLHIPPDAFVVLGSGYETWRKGKDLFIQLAARVGKHLNGREVHFLWVGGWQQPQHERNIFYDIERLGLIGRIHFTGEVTNPLDYFFCGDVFSLVSREDTFPLVCLEAASLGIPILCFDKAGGIPEFVDDDAGFVLPFLNIDEMAGKIVKLAKDEILRKSLGESAAQKVRDHFDLGAGAACIKEIIEDNYNL
jgi:glycosyltransferase involved in cell wall biosynthesis